MKFTFLGFLAGLEIKINIGYFQIPGNILVAKLTPINMVVITVKIDSDREKD